MTIEITNKYRSDLKTAREAGIKFSKQPTAIALYNAIDAYNQDTELHLPEEEEDNWFANQLVSTEDETEELYTTASDDDDITLVLPLNLIEEHSVPSNYGIVDSTIDDNCADDELISALSQPTSTLNQSPAIVMIVIIIAFLEVATRATSLGIAIGVIVWNKLYNWYYPPVASINYFSNLQGDTLWD